MKKILSIIILGVLLCSGLGAAVAPLRNTTKQPMIAYSEQFSSPIIKEAGAFVALSFDHMNAWFNRPGYPLVPAYRTTITLSFGTRVEDVHVTYSGVHTVILSKSLQPGTQPVPLLDSTPTIQGPVIDPAAYAITTMVPGIPYQYTVNAGLDGLTHVFYLTVTCYPVQYTPASRTLTWYDHLDVQVQTQAPSHPTLFGDQYDLLIIAPEKFTTLLQPLVTHKNTKGTRTALVTVENITAHYQGRDAPEKIKYAIKDMIETTGIHYVLLVGGIKSMIYATPREDANQGTKDWWVPVRYTNLYDGGTTQDSGTLSDLYYADIYNGTMNFSSWDSDNNNIFAQWKSTGPRDKIDLFPDVYVGRLACDNAQEVKTMVNKIITYESAAADSSWFKKMIVIGSDTFEDNATKYLEGEVENQKALNYMTGFTPIKIWGSNRANKTLVPVPWNIVPTISKGAGFVAFSGHGSAERWNAYWPYAFNEKRLRGLWFWDIPLIHNGEKLPIIVIGGCHNSQFNVTATGYLTGTPFIYSPVPECFSWLFDRNPRGGAIATFGNTGLGYGAVGENGDLDGDGINDPDCVEANGGYLESQFFKSVGENVSHDINQHLGAAWGAAITKYLTVYPGMNDLIDCKTVQEWALLGDPSLMIGGSSQ
ncbi:MAG TPA: C25 family cysteine peptidase [Candidatus Thermoplasmatota archaeon]|nr:C25 family cysteine peptidase [Candidatus Thermoplasmatota archaeon]